MRYTTLSASQLKLLLKLPFPGVEITALWRVMIKQCTGHQRRSIIGKQSLIRFWGLGKETKGYHSLQRQSRVVYFLRFLTNGLPVSHNIEG